MSNLSTTTLIGIAVVLVIVGGLLVALSANREQQELLSISDFEECVAAGFPVMETFPEQCRTPDGRTFVKETQATTSPAVTTPATDREPQKGPVVKSGCAVAGCSGQLCVSADEAGGIITTCEYRAEYACYKSASCERQANGKCGWTETPELKRCLVNPPASAPALETPEPAL